MATNSPARERLAGLQWFKSSRSANNGACVEAAKLPGGIAVRDSKDPDGTVLLFDTTSWMTLIGAIKANSL